MPILFRNLGDNVPAGWVAGSAWQIEYYPDAGDRGFPQGVAWVKDLGEAGTFITYVLVADDKRRQGIATKLIRACRERWPGLWLTEVCSEAGTALVKKLELQGSIFGENFPPKQGFAGMDVDRHRGIDRLPRDGGSARGQ
jgi:GNAT superfamily N-acetyltransferase